MFTEFIHKAKENYNIIFFKHFQNVKSQYNIRVYVKLTVSVLNIIIMRYH